MKPRHLAICDTSRYYDTRAQIWDRGIWSVFERFAGCLFAGLQQGTANRFQRFSLLVWFGSLVCLFAEPLPNQTTRYPGPRQLLVCWFGLLLTSVRLAIPARFCFDRVTIRSNAIQRATGGRAQA